MSPAAAPTGGSAARWRGFGPWRTEVRAFLELFALTGVTVVQPTLATLGDNPGLFLTLESSWLETTALVLLVVLVPPLLLWAVEVLLGLAVPRSRPYVHATLAAVVVGLLSIEVFKRATQLAPQALVAVAIGAGIAGGLLVWRFAVVRLWLRFLAIAPLVFAVLFLFSSPVTPVVFDDSAAPEEGLTVRNPKRIVMVVLDELPTESLLDGTGHVDADLFPHFAAFERDSTWFRNHTTVAPYTDEALPAILNGTYPAGPPAPPVASEYPRNLFTLLGGVYRMNVFEPVSRMCPTAVCPGGRRGSDTASSFGTLVDTTYDLWAEKVSPRRPSRYSIDPAETHYDIDPLRTADAFVRSLERSRGPQLDFLHVLFPHAPWQFRPSGQADGGIGKIPGLLYGLDWPTAWNASAGRQRHLLQVQAADAVLGQIVRKLKQIGEYDDSLIVVTADHGVAFTSQEPYRGVSLRNYPEILWTPLFVHQPSQAKGVIDDWPIETIDIMPTIADVIDADVHWKLDGASAFGRRRPATAPRLYPWELSKVRSPEGKAYASFSRDGFTSVLRARASAAPAGDDLRLYRLGPFGGLVGRRVEDIGTTTARGPVVHLEGPRRFDGVDPQAAKIPWAFARGTVSGTPHGVPIVVAVNGVVAGVSQTSLPVADAEVVDFWATLAPQLFRRGRNVLDVYVVNGTPADPKLTPVRLR